MSFATARHDRQWWPLSSKHSPNTQSLKPNKDTSHFFQSDLPLSRTRKPSSSSMKFSTFTSAMGFKSKKNSSALVIQDRPADIDTTTPPYTGEKPTLRQRSRPPAKSVSTVMSSDDANEPQTPSDFSRDATSPYQRSLLQTPDFDPFSSPGIRKPSQFPDPTRLSVWSGSSASDMMSRKSDLGVSFKRLSTTSSSTHSQYLDVDASANSSATSLPGVIEAQRASPTYVLYFIHNLPPFAQLPTRQPKHGHRRKQSLLSPGDPVAPRENTVNLGTNYDRHGSYPSLSKSGSSSTLTERNKSTPEPTPSPKSLSSSRPPSRPPSRPRGTTEGSSWSTSSIPDKLRGKGSASSTPTKMNSLPPYSNESHTLVYPSSRHPLIRQTSASRIGPPSAPPAQELPAPPVQRSSAHEGLTKLNNDSPESSSSSLSFASAVSAHTHHELPSNTTPTTSAHPRMDMDWQDEPGPSTMAGRRIVKRSISHQALPKRPHAGFTTSSGPTTPSEEMTTLERPGPRKQRSFHGGSRLILQSQPIRGPPPVPIPPQPTPSSSSQHDISYPVENTRRSSASGRKRLFSSGSNRRPPSQVLSTGEDDRASVFSGESELLSFINPFTTDSTSSTPQRDDCNDPPAPSSPTVASMNLAQKIVSPEELLRIEASFNDPDPYEFGSPKRQRVHSFASISTSMSEMAGLEGLQSPDSPRHYVVERGSNPSSRPRGSSNYASESGALRQSNSRTNMNVSNSATPSPTQPSFSPPTLGLPPPPRPRRRTVTSDRDSRPSSKPSTPTPTGPPPPPRRKSTVSSNNSNRSHPRGIMKKPSFLDIEDNDFNQRRPAAPSSRFVDNFLDLDKGKDSIDTIRSEEERENHR